MSDEGKIPVSAARKNVADVKQMHRWLGHRDAYADTMVWANRRAGELHERLRLTHERHTRRRAALAAEIAIYDEIKRRAESSLQSVKEAYDKNISLGVQP